MTEKMNQTPETRDKIEEKESKGLRNTVLTSAAAALLALNIQIGDGKNLENGQAVSIPESEVLEQVERQGVGDRISEGIKSMLAKGVDFVIPPAHANPFEKAAEDDSRGEDDWKEARDSYQETREERKQAQERAQEAQERAQEAQERAQEAQEDLNISKELNDRLNRGQEATNVLLEWQQGNADIEEAIDAYNVRRDNLNWYEANFDFVKSRGVFSTEEIDSWSNSIDIYKSDIIEYIENNYSENDREYYLSKIN
ncbi:hypothetical protein [Candidatus Absconditicoccus praedator]|uniref:hypothetical protein n=1 Tax=Candidatus Absconditicoccus praedator TaxID=2735562 RepID=UPI001E4B830E|nr:hypothetical protein [Candidatus Absconditicoccus praedator]UFX83121.1 hypothetical protein HLG78_03230 [Candidatus Absconditicoccus praedator]